MNLEIFKIKKDNIFCDDFNHLSKNNKVDFGVNKVNILYAPNGVGKSSLCKVLNGEGEFLLKYNGNTYDNSNCNIFHIISDQNSRNIIKGDAKDFLLGDDIVREFNLKEWLDQTFENIFNSLKSTYKDNLNISKKSDKKIDWLDSRITELVKSIVKSGAKPSDIDIGIFLKTINELEELEGMDYNEDNLEFIKNDLNTELLNEILNIRDITGNENFSKIEQCDDAVTILNKYHDLNSCIVCNNDNIDVDSLLLSKKRQKESIIDQLSTKDKNILEKIINKVSENDVFKIKNILTNAIVTGNIDSVNELIASINYYKKVYDNLSKNYLKNSFSNEFIDKYNQYKNMLNNELNFTDEDILFIEDFIANNINKQIKLERKLNKIVITLDSEDLLGVERQNLKLSSGEQNFISLTFELLKAKNCDKDIIVIDDPISSFDSIFKNKLVYSIIKFLNNKNVIILTHNIDLLKLIEFQNNDNFGLFLFNNFDGQENGFIEVSDSEKEIMISIPKLLSFIRSEIIENEIKNEKQFIYSLIPFMRGYSNFINDSLTKEELNKLMHGYKTDIVNITNIYNNIFSKNLQTIYEISVNDILNIDINNLPEIIDSEKYPLFNKVLTNNLTYLFLRLKTEKVLADKYGINTRRHDQLSSIIYEAFKTDTEENKKMRVFFYSKKTLLNEFNHFDGNMNIFQPAIDISEEILNKEKTEIMDKLNNIQ